jgi:hypothetical protein
MFAEVRDVFASCSHYIAFYVQGELLEADNAYYCEVCKKKMDAVRRACIKQLPHMLVIQLKRFEFDYETMTQLKLKQRFEFPHFLNVKPYTVEGLAEQERADAAKAEAARNDESGAERSGAAPDTDDKAGGNEKSEGRVGKREEVRAETADADGMYDYELVGVVVHSGTAFAGHYYSYIRERNGTETGQEGEEEGAKWLVFDDQRVEPYDISHMERDCFGGKYSTEVWDHPAQQYAQQEYERPNSAYMVLYERRLKVSVDDGDEEIAAVQAPAAAAETSENMERTVVGTPTGASTLPLIFVENFVEKRADGERPGDGKSRRGSLGAVEEGGAQGAIGRAGVGKQKDVTLPKHISKAVLEQNLKFVHESHLMDTDYFRFVRNLVEANSERYTARKVGLTAEQTHDCPPSSPRFKPQEPIKSIHVTEKLPVSPTWTPKLAIPIARKVVATCCMATSWLKTWSVVVTM